ncbi:MAG TPA: TonB-dependent receptor [Methylosinus sp.]
MGVTLAITAIGALATMAGPVVTPARASISREQRLGWVQSYDIPSGPMATALNTFAYVNGLHLAYEARVTESLRTGGLVGAFSTKEGLDRLLRGTGLGYRFSDNGRSVSIILAQNDGVRNDASGAEALPTIDIGAEGAVARPQRARSEEPATAAEGYVVNEASTGTKSDIPLKQTPASIVVVPKQVIADQNLTRLQDALENVSGLKVNTTDAQGHVFKIRGFTVIGTYRNNVSDTGLGTSHVTDLGNVERIEVLKGPASVLYGRSEPGGLINILTKQPLDMAKHTVGQEFGSFDHYRTQWDSTGPIEGLPGLSYRLSGAYQDSGSFRAFQGGRRVLVAPVVRYSPSAWTEFTLDTQFFHNAAQSDTGFPVWPGAFGSQAAPIPLHRSFQEANDPRDRLTNYMLSYNFRQNLAEDWKVTNRFLYSHESTDLRNLIPTLGADERTIQRSGQYQTIDANVFSTNIDLEGKFDTLGAHHKFLFGLSYTNRYFNYFFGTSDNLSFPIDMFAPTYGTVPSYAYDLAVLGSGVKVHASNLFRQKGFYVQDHVTLLDDRLHLLFGAGYEAASVVRGVAASFGGDYSASTGAAIARRLAAREQVDTGWSPRVGLVYDLAPQLSAYGAYSQSFGANNGLSAGGAALPPERGRQWEVGLKAQAFESLTATLAFYQLTKENISTRDYSSPDPSASKLAGLQRSRGIELDVIGRVTDRLSLVANYAHTDAKVIADNPKSPLDPFGTGLLGNHLDNAPRHSGKVFATYDFGENGFGWRVGGGVTAATQSWGDIQNTFVLPGWARVDALLSYTHRLEGHKVTAQLNLRNLNNARYYEGADIFYNANNRFNLFPSRPFTAVGTLRFEW